MTQPERPWETPEAVAARGEREAADRRLTTTMLVVGLIAGLPILALAVVLVAVFVF